VQLRALQFAKVGRAIDGFQQGVGLIRHFVIVQRRALVSAIYHHVSKCSQSQSIF
jgi:hypothetical protein